MNARQSPADFSSLERWIADAFAQIAGSRELDSDLTDQADEWLEPSTDADFAALRADRAFQDVERFLDRAQAWLHGRADALELLERLRDRLAPPEPPGGEEGDPWPDDAEAEGDAGPAEAGAPHQPPEGPAAGELTPLPGEDPRSAPAGSIGSRS